jgi:hypothetical protein
MNDSTFWRLLDELDWSQQGNDDRVVAPVLRALTRLPLKEIVSFQQILARKLYALDGRAWAREIGSGWWGGTNPVSVDAFLYARCAALTNGREQYEALLRDPKQMPRDLEFESLLYIAPKAWEAKAGEEWDLVTDVSYETYSNRAGWPPADPEPEVPHALPSKGPVQGIVHWEHGKHATRRLIRALIKGEIEDPVLSAHLAETGRVLVMTPASGVEPPREPDQPKRGPAPPWRAAIQLWTVEARGEDRQPSGLQALIELRRVSPTEVSARLVAVEPFPD